MSGLSIRRWVGLSAAGALLMVLVVPVTEASAATLSQTVTVPATQPWTDTGISLPAGTVSFTASGTINVNGGDAGFNETPAGDGPADPTCVAGPSSYSGSWTADGFPCWSLIGRIGNGAPFEIGDSATHAVSSPGELYLGVDDETGAFFDNSGSWTVKVSWSTQVTCGLNGPPYINGQCVYGNWAGLLGIGQGPYTRAQVHWVQPATHNLTTTSPVHETSIWVGLGGGSTVDKTVPVQVGTLMQTAPLGAPPKYSAVWEAPWAPSAQTIPNFTVKPGYQMTATVSYSNGEYSLYLAAKNPTTGKTQVWSPPPFKASYTNDTVEAIVEAPEYTDALGDHQYPLAPFKTVQFTATELGGVYALTMISNGHTLATTALPSLVVTFHRSS